MYIYKLIYKIHPKCAYSSKNELGEPTSEGYLELKCALNKGAANQKKPRRLGRRGRPDR